MKSNKSLVVLACAASLGFCAYWAVAQIPPMWVVVCGSFDVEGSCAQGGYYPPEGCYCEDGACWGNWTSPPQYNTTTFHSDDYGWKAYKKTVTCARLYPCIVLFGGDCSNDDDCGRDLNSPSRIQITHYEHVEPFAQWCDGGPA